MHDDKTPKIRLISPDIVSFDDSQPAGLPPTPAPIMSSDNRRPPHRSSLREFASTLGVLVGALVIALALIAFVFQSYEVEGASMESTLHDQDRLIVWKLPRTWARITGHDYVPKRGDVVIFTQNNVSAFSEGGERQLIKRVLGLPGERVVVNNGLVTIYNDDHPDGFQPDKTLPYGGNIPSTTGDIDVTLDDDEIFVCGDNRSNSLDSRVFGPVHLDQVVGKLLIRILPLSDIEKF
jgi:signal peptidase I